MVVISAFCAWRESSACVGSPPDITRKRWHNIPAVLALISEIVKRKCCSRRDRHDRDRRFPVRVAG